MGEYGRIWKGMGIYERVWKGMTGGWKENVVFV